MNTPGTSFQLGAGFRAACCVIALLFALVARSAEDGSEVVLDPAEGEISADSVFTVSFPAPMVGSDAISAGGVPWPIAVEPKLDAEFLWQSPSEGTLTVKGRVAPGTHYRIATAPNLKDARGRAVSPESWEFDSEPFEITTEEEELDELASQPKFELHANYPVSLSDAAEHIYFQDRDSHERQPADILIVAGESADRQTTFTVTPRKPLPAGRAFDVVVNGLADANFRTPLAYLHVFRAGVTKPLRIQWVGAFNHPLEKAMIRAKFSEQIDPDSVSPDALTVSPPVPNVKLHADQDEVIAEGDFNPTQRYTVQIAPTILGIRGYGLAAAEKWGATFHPKEPAIIFPGREIFQRSAAGLRFSLLQVNTGPLIWKLSEAPLDRLPAIAERMKEFKAGEPPLELKTVGQGRFDANNGAEEILREISWKPSQPLSGTYVIEATGSSAGGAIVGNRSLICFSEYLLTQKRSDERVLLRVARMSDGLPARGVAVRAVTKENVELARGVTDAGGVAAFPSSAMFPAKQPGAHLFIAETPSGPAVQYVDSPVLASADYRESGKEADLRLLVVTDRNLYRPGQTVKMHGIVRLHEREQLTVPPAAEAVWRIQPSGGEPIADGRAPLSRHGGWDGEWNIPTSLGTGEYEIACEVNGAKAVQGRFRVEEYRVPQFSVIVEKTEKPGSASEVRVSSAYFHGAPNAGARVHWKALWTPDREGIGPEDEYVRFDAYSERNGAEEDQEKEAEGDAALDANGVATLRCEAPFADGRKRGRCLVSWTIDVTSPEAQTLTGGTEARVQFASALAGVRARRQPGEAPGIRVEADAIDIANQPARGTPIRIELFHVDVKTVQEKVAPFISRYRNNRQFAKVAAHEAVTPARLDIPADKTGDYVVVVTGPGGVPVSTTAFIDGEQEAELPVENDREITLSLPEPARPYLPGEVAPISVQSPFPGVAWVSVEAGEVLDTLLVPLAGNAGRINLPVKKEYAPNATVTVYFVQPGGNARLPRERIGVLRLDVARPDRELTVTPKLASDTVRPGAPLRGELTVVSENRPVAGADFVVFAVDEAVLQLGDWKLPDCKAAFYPERAHGVSTFSALSRFVENIERRSLMQKGYVVGDGGEALGNVSAIRKEFKTLAFWESNLTTDASGRIAFEFNAPDNLTTYRIVAIGQTDQSQFGAGTATFKVSKPLLCEAALPRFVRVGDLVYLRAVARQNKAPSANIRVQCSAEGLDLEGPMPEARPAPKDAPTVFSFAARVRDGSSAVKVRFDATSDIGESDSVEVSLPVQPPTILRRETVAATVRGTSFLPAEVAPKPWQGGKGVFNVTLSTSPWLPKLNGLPTILEYPHGCFEQISSRFLTYALMTDLLSNLPDAAARDAHYRAMIEAGLKQFNESLLDNGLLPYWPGQKDGNPFVTTLAAWAVREAGRAGIDVPERLSSQLRETLGKIVGGQELPADPLTRCMALMVASAPDADPENANVAEDLYLRRDRLTDEARAMLAIAMHRLNVLPREKAQLLREISKPVAERAFDPDTFASTTRAEAVLTLAFAQMAPTGLQTKQRRDRLLKLLDSASNLSTQENLWLLLAFKAVSEAKGASPLDVDLVAPKPQLVSKNASGVEWSNIDLAKLAAFKLDGLPAGAPLSALVSAEYRRDETETDRTDRGLRIERVVRDLTDPKRTGTSESPFKLGDQLLVTYRLLSRKLHHYIALEDLLPAGMETVNPNLPLIAKTYRIPADPEGRTLDLSHSELRDQSTCLYFDRLDPGVGVYSVLARATSAGTFRWPPVQAYPMYDTRFTGVSVSSPCVVSE